MNVQRELSETLLNFQALLEDGAYSQVIEQVSNLVSLGIWDEVLLDLLAEAYSRNGNAESIETLLFGLVEIEGASVSLLYFAADVLVARANYSGASEILQRILTRNDSDQRALLSLSEIRIAQGRLVESVIILKRLIKTCGDSADLSFRVAQALLCSGTQDEYALDYARKAISLSPQHSKARIIIAKLLRKSGQIRNALIVLNEGLRLDPKSIVLLKELASILETIGDFNEAMEIYERAVAIAPEDESLFSEQQQLHAKMGESSLQASFPRVTIVIPTCSGVEHLPELLEALELQLYPYFDVVIVDDHSEDKFQNILEKHPHLRIVRLPKRLGFAEACNIGLDVAFTEFVVFLNDDTVVDSLWLFALVARIAEDSRIAAVSSKVLFFEKFIPVHIVSTRPILLDRSRLLNSLSDYQKAFFSTDMPQHLYGSDWKIKQKGRVLVPTSNSQVEITLSQIEGDNEMKPLAAEVTVNVGDQEHQVTVAPDGEVSLNINLSDVFIEDTVDVINNAGNELDSQGNSRDLGLGWPDRGQYNKSRDLSGLCGCSFIIRRKALGDMPLFIGSFEAYWEDNELATRLRAAGHRIVYEPRSVVRHKHASSTKEHSSRFWYLVTRNHIAFLALHHGERFARRILARRLAFLRKELAIDLKALGILQDIDRLLLLVKEGKIYQRSLVIPRFAIYNEYWSTMGGGEKRALELAEYLQDFGVVDLISTREIPGLNEFEERFGISLNNVNLVTTPSIEEVTERYDLFVNSTHGSTIASRAKKSVMLTSFPDVIPRDRFHAIDSYDQIWANSFFTARWVKGRWKRSSEVVYPGGVLPKLPAASVAKESIFLVVGRFFQEGHCKQQKEIVKAFRDFIDSGPHAWKRWKLVLLGTVQDERYYLEVQELAKGYPIEIYRDVSLEEVRLWYQRSAFLVHATGLGKDPRKFPEQMEHFGIAVCEAMSYGSIPIIYPVGGPMEILGKEKGFIFRSKEELSRCMLEASHLFERESLSYRERSSKMIARAVQFGKTERTQSYRRSLESLFSMPLQKLSNDTALACYGATILGNLQLPHLPDVP